MQQPHALPKLLGDESRIPIPEATRWAGEITLLPGVHSPAAATKKFWHRPRPRQPQASCGQNTQPTKKSPGRPRIRQVIVDLTVKFAKENPTWGDDRIQGELAKVGYKISDTTVANILKAHGIEPAATRKRIGSWETFLTAHWNVMAAIDFTTLEVWTKSGLVTFYLLFVMELKRAACISPVARPIRMKPG